MTKEWLYVILELHNVKMKLSNVMIYTLGIRDGNRAGQGRRMGSSSLPRMVLSYLIPVLSHIMEKTFSPFFFRVPYNYPIF